MRTRFLGSLSEISNYTKLVLKKWVLWLFVLLDLIALIVQFVAPKLGIPPTIYGVLVLIGFFWAGFNVYRESVEKHKDTVNAYVEKYEDTINAYKEDLQKISAALNVDALLKKPNISLSLVEGGEYTYTLYASSSSQMAKALSEVKKVVDTNTAPEPPEYHLPDAALDIHLRIENVGCNMDILIISADIHKRYEIPFSVWRTESKSNGETIKYPIHLEPNTLIQCDIEMLLCPSGSHSRAQFASRLKDFRDQKTYMREIKLWLEAADPSGHRETFAFETVISIRPLIELYLSHWQKAEQFELIRLAGGALQAELNSITVNLQPNPSL